MQRERESAEETHAVARAVRRRRDAARARARDLELEQLLLDRDARGLGLLALALVLALGRRLLDLRLVELADRVGVLLEQLLDPRVERAVVVVVVVAFDGVCMAAAEGISQAASNVPPSLALCGHVSRSLLKEQDNRTAGQTAWLAGGNNCSWCPSSESKLARVRTRDPPAQTLPAHALSRAPVGFASPAAWARGRAFFPRPPRAAPDPRTMGRGGRFWSVRRGGRTRA